MPTTFTYLMGLITILSFIFQSIILYLYNDALRELDISSPIYKKIDIHVTEINKLIVEQF